MNIVVNLKRNAHLKEMNDTGKYILLAGFHYCFWLDECELTFECPTPSEEDNWVLCYQRNEDGSIFQDKEGGVELKLLKGRVELEKETSQDSSYPKSTLFGLFSEG